MYVLIRREQRTSTRDPCAVVILTTVIIARATAKYEEVYNML